MKVVIALHHPFALWNAPAWLAERLRSEFPDVIFAQTSSYDELGPAIVDADVLFGWSIRPDQFHQARSLKWIHSTAAAVHQLLFPEVVSSPVVVTNARSVHAPVVAEHAIALVLALAKLLPLARDFQREHIWAQQRLLDHQPTIREIAGSTVCVVGMGSIGREFTQRARALGMRVVAVREHPGRGPDGADQVFGPPQLTDALQLADFVLLATPLTAETHHLIDAAALGAMRPGAYLINVGRGPLIDDAALLAALREDRLAGAALDVFGEEPLPPDSPYWSLPNVFITPHTAAVTGRLWDRHLDLMRHNLRNFLSNQPLTGLVDKARGY